MVYPSATWRCGDVVEKHYQSQRESVSAGRKDEGQVLQQPRTRDGASSQLEGLKHLANLSHPSASPPIPHTNRYLHILHNWPCLTCPDLIQYAKVTLNLLKAPPATQVDLKNLTT